MAKIPMASLAYRAAHLVLRLGLQGGFIGTWTSGMASPKRRNPTGKARRRRAQNPVRWPMLDLKSGASPDDSEMAIGLSHQVNSY